MFHSLKVFSFSILLLFLLTVGYVNTFASSDDGETINQADQAVTTITLPPAQQALLHTEKIGYKF